MATLTDAHREWASRPADERFASFAELHDNARADRTGSKEVEVPADALSVGVRDNSIWLRAGEKGAPMNEWAFAQACRLSGAPPGYLETLTTNTAACALSESLSTSREERKDSNVRLLVRHGQVAAINGPRYGRIWDADVLDHVKQVPGTWVAPKAYAHNGSNNAGLYRGQRDMFVFLVDETTRIADGRNGLSRGFFVWNSEVGARSFGICTFLYDYICGNHYVWGATDVLERRLRHVGNMAWDRARGEIELNLHTWAQEGAAETEAQIKVAQNIVLGKDKEEVTAAVLKAVDTSQKLVSNAWEGASQWADVDSPRNTAWGMVQAITRYSQSSPWAADRVETDRVAGELLRVVLKAA